jgi:integrase
MKLKYPKIHTDKNQRVFVSFYIDDKRYRLYNGKRIATKTDPNSFPIEQRKDIAKVLATEVYSFISEGGRLNNYRTDNVLVGKRTDKECLQKALESKLNSSLSEKYKRNLTSIYNRFVTYLDNENVTKEQAKKFLDTYTSNTSYNTVRRHLNALFSEALTYGISENPLAELKSKKSIAKLHKPFTEIQTILNEIKGFNSNLHLCCLLTYGCLLRPHREVRELMWGDFSDDLSFINLSGERNKSGRNRIVPVPKYIKETLVKGEANHNIFTANTKAHNSDYFKTLWSRFKKQSNLLEQGQTLYSFRHTGAIEIFKRTGSITKLQKAMGHASINVSLTYLRGLEVAELEERDMPMI